MVQAILAAMLALPLVQYPKGDEDPETKEAREARYEVIAQGIDFAVRTATCSTLEPVEGCTPWWPADQGEQLASMLVSLGWWESKFMLRIHENKCRTNECDSFKSWDGTIGHRAKSVWQVQRNPRVVSKKEWEGMGGASQDQTNTAALVAARVLAASRSRCAKGMTLRWEHPSVAAYATGFACSWSGADKRVTTYKRTLARIVSASKAASAKNEAPAMPAAPATQKQAALPLAAPRER